MAKGHLLYITSGTSVDFYRWTTWCPTRSCIWCSHTAAPLPRAKPYEIIITTFSDSIPEFARRLNATLGAYQQQSDAFQALLTSDAAEITVTAPDGTTHKMIPWKRVTSEGRGRSRSRQGGGG